MSDSDLGLRRYKTKELTVGEAISLGYRAQTSAWSASVGRCSIFGAWRRKGAADRPSSP